MIDNCACSDVLLLSHIAVVWYVDAACFYRPSSVVCPSVCHSSEPCKNGWTDWDVIWVEESGWPSESHISTFVVMQHVAWVCKQRPILVMISYNSANAWEKRYRMTRQSWDSHNIACINTGDYVLCNDGPLFVDFRVIWRCVCLCVCSWGPLSDEADRTLVLRWILDSDWRSSFIERCCDSEEIVLTGGKHQSSSVSSSVIDLMKSVCRFPGSACFGSERCRKISWCVFRCRWLRLTHVLCYVKFSKECVNVAAYIVHPVVRQTVQCWKLCTRRIFWFFLVDSVHTAVHIGWGVFIDVDSISFFLIFL